MIIFAVTYSCLHSACFWSVVTSSYSLPELTVPGTEVHLSGKEKASSHQRSAVPTEPLQQSRGREATQRGTRSGGWSIGALARHPRPGERNEKKRQEPGEERKCPAPGAKASWADLLAQLPLAERILLSQWDWAGRKGKAVRTQWPDGPAAPLPLSRVSGWTTVNVAMSAVGAEVTLSFSISNRL
ncbi:hypothetical protein I79_016383 [Cricetulus griseus]|uniref:Uncharacterized protein n=1 Tax=Cricetulus griseus TaxID=10029 RepID=G3HZ86_CRIGR|nr:hypothetical protein I79_016383 [Cricetulus griseus]